MCDMDRLKRQVEFIIEIDKVKEIFRMTTLLNSKRKENDSEHSWHITLMAPLLKEYIKEEVDLLKVMKMTLIHDLVEIDAGDTYCYDYKGYEDKREREEKAAERIFNILPKDQADEVFELWYEFEEMNTSESKYAATLDRLQPILLNYNNNGQSWIDNKVCKSQVLKRMDIIRETSDGLWQLVLDMVNDAVSKGWLIDK